MNKSLIEHLSECRSLNNGTCLVTLYVPGTAKINDVNKMVSSEISKTPNIKSKHTRQGVQDALQAISTHIKNMKSTPNNGIAFFTGPTIDGFESVAIEPLRPIDRFFYRCENSFCV